MQRALHPGLPRRIQTTDSSGQLVVADVGARELIDRTAAGTGSADPTRRHDVRVLVFGRAASVRVDATGWVDYPHLIHTPRATAKRKASHVEVWLAGHRFLERTQNLVRNLAHRRLSMT
jgi:hypothetical protein